ncbi:MAG: purine-binding chemotaxis protein CheW [Gammaproteobacteria bacterium]|nr:purine-binding chemotaxis protein CheW [Gammaproteobacteria bacterium]
MSLKALTQRPFELLLELERLARAAVAARDGGDTPADEWVGIGFRLGKEQFVTGRADVREVLPVPDQITRVPGGKSWLRGIANLRGQLLTVVDLRAFLGAGSAMLDRKTRIMVVASREVPTGLVVDEVVGFRRFGMDDYKESVPPTVIRCEHYLEGGFSHGADVWPRFSLRKLLGDEQFLNAGEALKS